MPLTPKNRKEEWLQGLVDHETTLTPKNRPEEWMKEIIDASGGGGGTGGGVLVANANVETGALDKTWNEIKNSTPAFIVVNVAQSKIISFVAYIGAGEDGKYYIGAISYREDAPNNMGLLRLVTDSADGYPVLQDN